MERIILTTGGTGGHIFPALAVAEEVRGRYPKAHIVFVGSQSGPEKEMALKAGLEFVGFQVHGVLGRGLRGVMGAWNLVVALVKAIRLMRLYKPQVVVGFGGYAAFAPVMAARLCKIPTAIHEQNAIAGASNRIVGKFVDKVLLSLKNTKGFPADKCVLTGNAVRQSVVLAGQNPQKFTGRCLLIMGGSQGARALNEAIMAVLPHLRAAGIALLHQTGHKDVGRVSAAYVAAGYSADCVSAFIMNMAEAYAWADLVLCRAGASSVAELAVAGKPSILVPFPYATHDHQTHNAQTLVEHGAAILVKEKDLNAEELAGLIVRLLNDEKTLRGMSHRALAQGQPRAAALVVEQMEYLLSPH